MSKLLKLGEFGGFSEFGEFEYSTKRSIFGNGSDSLNSSTFANLFCSDSINSSTFANLFCSDSINSPTFANLFCLDSPDLPTFAKGHFWKNVTRIWHIRTSNLPFSRIWGEWPLLSFFLRQIQSMIYSNAPLLLAGSYLLLNYLINFKILILHVKTNLKYFLTQQYFFCLCFIYLNWIVGEIQRTTLTLRLHAIETSFRAQRIQLNISTLSL